MEWEKMAANNATNKGLISRIHKQLIQLYRKRKRKKKLKTGQKTWIDISPKTTYRWRQAHEKMLTSLIIREMQIRTPVRYHLTPARMAIINKSTNKDCWRGCGDKGTLLLFWWECKLLQPLWKIVCKFLRKLNIELPYDLAILLLGLYLHKTFTKKKNTCTRMFIIALFAVAKTWKQHKYPLTDEWIERMWNICTREYYSAIKKRTK